MHAWEEQYGWEVPHLWDYPMLPTDMTEASCAKCHTETVYVDEAENLNLAYGLYERAGCYACHTTTGFTELRKPGPQPHEGRLQALTGLGVFVDSRSPGDQVEHVDAARLVQLEHQQSGGRGSERGGDRYATVAYLFANSEDHDFAVLFPPRGNAERGQRARRVRRLPGVPHHGGAGPPGRRNSARRTFGQPLQNIGNKTSYEWLFDWVRDPQHFSSETYMPDLRLTNREAADVATYLTTLTGPEGRAAEATYDDSEVTAVLLDYVRSILPTAEAEELVGGMSLEEQRLDLGQRVIGRYGCFSCHEIAGFEDSQPIGIELSEEGSKLLPRLDFAFVHDIPHTKVEWFKQKMRDPRAFDRNRVLQPLEKLRMPNFEMSEEESKLFATAIMSFQSDVQPLAAKVPELGPQRRAA